MDDLNAYMGQFNGLIDKHQPMALKTFLKMAFAFPAYLALHPI